MEKYFQSQLRLNSTVDQLVQFILLKTGYIWDDDQPLSPTDFQTKMTVHPHYDELKDMIYCGSLPNSLPVFKEKEKK